MDVNGTFRHGVCLWGTGWRRETTMTAALSSTWEHIVFWYFLMFFLQYFGLLLLLLPNPATWKDPNHVFILFIVWWRHMKTMKAGNAKKAKRQPFHETTCLLEVLLGYWSFSLCSAQLPMWTLMEVSRSLFCTNGASLTRATYYQTPENVTMCQQQLVSFIESISLFRHMVWPCTDRQEWQKCDVCTCLFVCSNAYRFVALKHVRLIANSWCQQRVTCCCNILELHVLDCGYSSWTWNQFFWSFPLPCHLTWDF